MRPFIYALILVCASAAAQDSGQIQDVKPQQATATSPGSAANDETTRQEAARQAIAGGWQHLKSGNAAVAIKLFNAAATLSPNDASVYWGLGAATAQQRKFGVAVQLFERAGMLDPKNVRLAADAGLAYTRAATDNMSDLAERATSLQKALAWFDKAEKLDPGYALTYANRAIALAYLGDYDKAWESVARAEALEQKSIDPKLIAYLSEKRPRPETAAPAKDIKLAQAETSKPQLPTEKGSESAEQQDIPSAKPAPTPVTPSATPAPQQPAEPTAQPPAAPAAAQIAAPAAIQAEKPKEQSEKSAPSEPPAEQAQDKTLRVITGQPVSRQGRDVRHCLDLPTNEAIIRCVYPRR